MMHGRKNIKSGNQGLKNERDDCYRCVASTDDKPQDVGKSSIMLPENHRH